MHPPALDDALLARVAQGDQAAVQQLVASKLPRLLGLGMRMLNDRAAAEDVAQETFVRIWRHAAQWRPGQAQFDTWMHRVALNLCYDPLRKRPELPLQDAPEQEDPAATPEQDLMQRQQGERVNRALASLPQRQREALVLQYYQGLSNIEAAELMQLSVDALESLLARGRRNMRSLLADTVNDKEA